MGERNIMVAVIDSGYDNNGANKGRIIGGYCISAETQDYFDEMGHGTAIVDLIAENTEKASFFIIKSYGNNDLGKSADLLKALQYIYQSLVCDIVHISAGVRSCYEMPELIDVICKLRDRGTIVISAFDNAGALSYPASLDNVIGVDVCGELRQTGQYFYVESDTVNVRYADIHYRVKWKDTRTLERGSSYACAMVTAKAVNALSLCPLENARRPMQYVLDKLKADSYGIVENTKYPSLPKIDKFVKDIKKAIAFPFNKELFTIAAFEKELIFSDIEYYDVSLSGNVGKRISEILPYTQNDKLIKSIDNLDWNSDFDTFILGHTNVYESFSKGLTQDIVYKCGQFDKRIFSFSNIMPFYDLKSSQAANITFPYIDVDSYPQNRFGKLRQGSRPVTIVCGTSSKQGKFSLQMIIREKLSNRGYKTFHISTEPYGALLGADKTYPAGYDSTIYTDSIKNVSIINEMLFEAERKGAEIILAGLQSQTAPAAYFNMKYIPIQQYEMLYGLNPDAAILVINLYDDIRYIIKTKDIIESTTRAKVIAFAMLPTYQEISKAGLISKKKACSAEQLELMKKAVFTKTGLQLYIIGIEPDMENITDCIINCFGGEM